MPEYWKMYDEILEQPPQSTTADS